MSSANPTKSFLMEGGAECEELVITHSNPLQEVKEYRYTKKRPEEGNPIKFFLLNFGTSVQPGDPVRLRGEVTGEGVVEARQDNYDNNEIGDPGSAWFRSHPPEQLLYEDLTWPCELDISEVLTPWGLKRELNVRSQRSTFRPGLSNEEIRASTEFANLMDSWLSKRDADFHWLNDFYPPPPEEYEIENQRSQVLQLLRDFFEIKWGDWILVATTNEQSSEGEVWTGQRDSQGNPIFTPYSFRWFPEIQAQFHRTSDDAPISGEGLDPVTLLAYEFVSEVGLDIAKFDDWTNVLRLNFLGTPAPLTVTCGEPCEEGCLGVYSNQGTARLCVCKDTKVNETDGYEYQPYSHNQSNPRLNEFNP